MNIYVESRSAQTDGKSESNWISVPDNELELAEAISEVTAGAEDWMVTEYDGLPSLGTTPSLEDLILMKELVGEHGLEAVSALFDYEHNLQYMAERLENGFVSYSGGEEEALASYAESMADEGLFSTETLLRYIDFEALGRDLGINDVLAIETYGKTFIFSR